MANKAKITNKGWVAEQLRKLMKGESELSYHLLRQLTEQTNYVEAFFEPDGSIGHPVKQYRLTVEGKRLANLKMFTKKTRLIKAAS